MALRLALSVVVALLLAGCSAVTGRQPPATSRTRPPDSSPPPVRKPEAGEVHTGRASWYGGFHDGRLTASGERFDADAMTAAHRSLPFGTWLLVENVANGRTVKVRVNDRGPAVDGRVLDVSHAAARALGVTGGGVFDIRYRVVGRD